MTAGTPFIYLLESLDPKQYISVIDVSVNNFVTPYRMPIYELLANKAIIAKYRAYTVTDMSVSKSNVENAYNVFVDIAP